MEPWAFHLNLGYLRNQNALEEVRQKNRVTDPHYPLIADNGGQAALVGDPKKAKSGKRGIRT
jgi:hypothetical protein